MSPFTSIDTLCSTLAVAKLSGSALLGFFFTLGVFLIIGLWASSRKGQQDDKAYLLAGRQVPA